MAILGNHDYWCAPEGVRKQLARPDSSSWVTEASRDGARRPLVASATKARGFGPAGFSRLPCCAVPMRLSHTPDNIGWARRNGVDLMFNGHPHGGQIRLPIFGPLFVPSRYSRKYDGGCYEHGPTTLYVSRGLSGREPLRWNCLTEITRLRLVA